MVRIRCMGLEGGSVGSNSYKAPSGQRYTFNRKSPINIYDRADAEYFLKCNNGEGFKKVNKAGELISDLKAGLAEIAKEMPWPKKKEEEIAKEAVEGTDEEKQVINTRTEIRAMSKREQIDIIKELGQENTRVPGLERGRIDLIIKLQGGN